MPSSDYRLVQMENSDFVIQKLDHQYGPGIWRDHYRSTVEMNARLELSKLRRKEAEEFRVYQDGFKGRSIRAVLDEI